MLTETRDERLTTWFDPNHYERSDTKFVINESGLELECKVSNDSLKFHLESENNLKYLKRRNVADIIVFEFTASQNIRLHIIECKATVKIGNPEKNNTWAHIKMQFEGALLNALGVLGVLNLSESDIDDIVCYTAYKNDRAGSDKVQPTILRNFKNEIDEWEKGKFSILSISEISHKKIQMNSSGKGTVYL